jgi:predicted nucleotide-binding protein (sugar kinase/HSP70/actin superfamily)
MGCNIGMFPATIKALLESHGGGFEHAGIYAGSISTVDLSLRGAIDNYLAHVIGGYLRRASCRIRPYERRSGATDEAVADAMRIARDAFRGRVPKLDAARRMVDRLLDVAVLPGRRPKVAIFGDLYTRDNEVANQQLVRFIEQQGGEVVTTPYSEYAKLIANAYFRKWVREGHVGDAAVHQALLSAAKAIEQPVIGEFNRVLGDGRGEPRPLDPERALAPFGVTTRHTGESFDNLLKTAHLVAEHPDLSLLVQANPAYCCPALVTEAMGNRIEEVTGVPVVTVTYDGTASAWNDVIVPYLAWPRRR